MGSTFFDDPIVAAAMFDRFTHRSAIIAIDGESYRMRAHREQTETLRTARRFGGPTKLVGAPGDERDVSRRRPSLERYCAQGRCWLL